MASYTLSPIGGAGSQFFDNSGNVLSGGKLYTYAAGTTTPQATWTTPAGNVQNSNPIILNAAGRPANEIWLSAAYSYKFVIKDSNDVLIATYDNIPGLPQPAIVNDASSISYEQGNTVTAGSFIVGEAYMIASLGTTDFVSIGAAYNSTGQIFIATGVGSGTGTAFSSRTVQNKLQETVSVKDFGAVGDGVTDDTVAIQAACDYVYNGGSGTVFGGEVYFPVGEYKVTTEITLGQRTSIRGAGKGASSLQAYGCSGFYAANTVNGTYNITIRDISIGGDGLGTTKHGIEFVGDGGVNVAQVHLENITVGGFSGSGVYLYRPIVTEIEQVISSSNGEHGFHIIGDGTSLTMTSCWGRLNTGDGYRIDDDMSYCTFNGCAADDNTNGYNFNGSIASPATNIVLNGCGSEVNTGTYFLFTASQGITLNSLSVYKGSGSGVGGSYIYLNGVRNASLNGIRMAAAPTSGYALNIGTLGGTQFPDNITSAGCNFYSVNNSGSSSAYVDLNNAMVTTAIVNDVTSGYNGLVVSHSLGKVPTVVIATAQSNQIIVGTDLYTSSTFRLLMRDYTGTLVPSGSPVDVAWMAK